MTATTEPLSDAIGRGVAASRPAAGIAGRLYFATDTVALSRDNGTSWDTIAIGSSLTVKDEGSSLTTDATILDFVGAGVVASGTGATKTITVAGAALTVEDADASPTDSAVTKLVFPEGSVSIASHIATIRDVPRAFIGCQITSTAQTLNNTTQTPLTATTEVFDSDGFHDVGSNTSRFTIPAGLGGKYLVTATGYWTNNGGGNERTLFVTVNNGTPLGRDTRSVNASVFKHANVSAIVDVVPGDYIEVQGYQDRGGTLDFNLYRGSIVKLDSGKVGAGIGCSVSGTSTALGTAAYTSLAFEAADTFDTDGFHDPASNNTRLTVPAGLGGKYLLTVRAQWPNTTSGSTDKRLTYRINGGSEADLLYRSQHQEGTGTAGVGGGVVAINLAGGDYVEVRMYANNASQTTVNYGAQLMRIDSGTGAYTGPLWGSGTAFPSGPATNDRFTRTDRGLDYYYDGTRWLTTTLYREPIASSLLGLTTTTAAGRLATWHTTYDLWLETLYSSVFITTTNNGTNFWTVTLGKVDAANAGTTIVSFTSAADAINTWVTRATAIGALLVPATYKELEIQIAKTLSPGTIFPQLSLAYRLVG